MPDPTNPNSTPPPRGETGARGEHQETLLLSDVPDAVALVNETAPLTATSLNLSSMSLAALSQRYDILAEAGHGSMGNVYKARDRETGETVALKLLKPEIASDQAMMERFKNELLFARKITHKNVCRVHDFNRIGGLAYTSMEFVEGESLRSVMNRFGGLPVRKAIGVALQICSGLKEAHAQGIVHRDLKPENVMIDSNGNVKIMDFGIARSMEAGTRLTGSMVGTPAYMAPEQVGGKAIDYRTDIYSLGLMLYEMFTGTPAFTADTPVAVALKQLRETPPPPHEVEPTIPVAIERAILKCLEKEPSKRFQSVAELEKVLGGPGLTGTSSGLAPFATSHLGTPTLVRLPSPAAVQEKSSHVSPVIWVLFGGVLVFAGLAGAQWAKNAKAAEQIPPPPSLPAPKPPDFALTNPASESPASVETKAAKPAEKKPAEKKPEAVVPQAPPPTTEAAEPSKPVSTGGFPAVELPGKKKSARQQELEGTTPPAAVQQRADKAFGETNSTDTQETMYLWVGRYQQEDKANQVVKKIKGFGLPVAAIQRTGLTGPFWIVVTGPFTPKRVSDVTQWLEAQGYLNVHEFKLPGAKPTPGTQPK
jgi:serine/threonine protein kinase